MDLHNTAVATTAAHIQKLHAQGIPFRIYHGSTNSTRPLSFDLDQMVDISSFSRVVKVDSAARTVLVEPNVPMDQLVAATLDHGLVPPVVMEFPGITVGGGFAGTGGESSSFRYGLFDRTVNWIEVILATGEIVIASEDERPDLFRGAAGTFGTLGVTTLLEIRLIEAKKFVELTYIPVSSSSEAIAVAGQKAEDPSIDYLDGILFAADKGVICAGRLSDGSAFSSSNDDDSSTLSIQRFNRASDPWFYMHASDVSAKSSSFSGELTTELVPLTDYLFRYDRGGFWVGLYAFQYFITPFNSFTRWLLDRLTRTRVMYHALHKSGFSNRYIVQDLALPLSTAKQFIDYADENFSCYPLWLCPLRTHEGQFTSLHPIRTEDPSDPSSVEVEGQDKENMMMNVGVWCPGPSSHEAFVEANRAIEHKVFALGGMKWLYAHTYYTENEFWTIYNRDWYDALRKKYHATSLPTMYEKVHTDLEAGRRSWAGLWSIWPFAGVYGVLSAVFGGGYLLPPSRTRRIVRSFALTLPVLLIYHLVSG